MTEAIEKICIKHGLTEMPDRKFVSLYKRARCYGGPEEGGWYYSWYTLVRYAKVCTKEQAIIMRNEMEDEVTAQLAIYEQEKGDRWASLPDAEALGLPTNHEGDYVPTGWSDGHKLEIMIEDVAGENESTERPFYE